MGGYFLYNHKFNYTILNESKNKFIFNYDELDMSGKVVNVGNIKLSDKKYKVSYNIDPSTTSYKEINGKLLVGDKEFAFLGNERLYLINNLIILFSPRECDFELTILDSNLETKLSKTGFSNYIDTEEKVFEHYNPIDLEKQNITYYIVEKEEIIKNGIQTENAVLSEYNIELNSDKLVPKKTDTFEVLTYGCMQK